MPFAPDERMAAQRAVSFSTFEPGDDVASLAATEFWVPPYSFDFAATVALGRMPKLKVVQTQSAGVDGVAEFIGDGVRLCNARGVHDAATSEMGIALILASLRQLPRFIRAQDRAHWDRDQLSTSLADRRVLIIGHGSIGRALESRLEGFECDITRVARSARQGVHGFDELPGLVGAADIIVLLTPLTAQTQHLADSAFLGRMADGALLVNLGRGPLVDTDALIAQRGRINAALDVTDPEPLPDGHPLWSVPGVLITPHVGGGTTAMQPRIMALIADQLERYVAGRELLNVIPSNSQ